MIVPDAKPMELPTVKKNLRVLIVEDLQNDAELLVRELQRFGYLAFGRFGIAQRPQSG